MNKIAVLLLLGICCLGFCGTHSAYSGFFPLNEVIAIEQPEIMMPSAGLNFTTLTLTGQTVFQINLDNHNSRVHSSLKIFDISGKLVKTFYFTQKNSVKLVWDMEGSRGTPVGSGVYIGELNLGSSKISKSFVVLN